MERYAEWTQPDRSPFDPWLRVHWRMGAAFLQIAPRSMIITGMVAEWEEWTNRRSPESGTYVVPGALQPITIDRDANLGRYEEANVWMAHRIGRGRALELLHE